MYTPVRIAGMGPSAQTYTKLDSRSNVHVLVQMSRGITYRVGFVMLWVKMIFVVLACVVICC